MSSDRDRGVVGPTVVDFRRKRVVPRYLPLTAVVCGVLLSVGLLLVDFRLGVLGLAICVSAAFVLRLVMSEAEAGLLVVRSRRVDLAMLATLAVALIVLAVIVPVPVRG